MSDNGINPDDLWGSRDILLSEVRRFIRQVWAFQKKLKAAKCAGDGDAQTLETIARLLEQTGGFMGYRAIYDTDERLWPLGQKAKSH